MHTTLRSTLLLLLLASPLAHAEKADREKPVVILSDKVTADDRNKVQIFEGRVKLVQGTLEISSDKLVVSQDAEGFQKGIATGGKDGLARFRQKREGVNEYAEGEAERIEYEGRADKAKLFTRAITRNGNDELRGQYIEYDSYTSLFSATSGPNASVSKNPGERVCTVKYPKGVAPDPSLCKP